MNSTKGAHELQKKNSRVEQGAERKGLWRVSRQSTLPLRYSDQRPGESTNSKLWNLDMQVQCYQKTTQRVWK